MVRYTPNGFEQFMTWLHKAFLLFCTLTVLYRVISYQNVFGIVIKSMQEILYPIFDYPHEHYTFKHFEV